MIDFASQIGAFIGTSVILFIATQPKRGEQQRRGSTGSNTSSSYYNDDDSHNSSDNNDITTNRSTSRINVIFKKGAKKYSREGQRLSSFGMHDDFDM